MMAAGPVLAITGHRPGRLSPAAPALIRQKIGELAEHCPDAAWLVGGALGSDAIATDELLRRGAWVHVILPFPVGVHTARWSPVERQALLHQLERAASFEVVRPTYHVSGYHERNRRLVQRADLLVAIYDGRPTGGTAATLRAARRRQVAVYWLEV